MLRSRRKEVSVLGYPVERIDEFNQRGELLSVRYDVLCPITGSRLASCPQQSQAHEFVIRREMASIRFPATAAQHDQAA